MYSRRSRVHLLTVAEQGSADKPFRADLHPDFSRFPHRLDHRQQFSAKESSAVCLVAVIVGAVAIVKAHQSSRTGHLHPHPVTGIFHRISPLIDRADLQEQKILPVRFDHRIFRVDPDGMGIAEGPSCTPCDLPARLIIRHCSQGALLIGHLIIRQNRSPASRCMGKFPSAQALTVQKQFHLRCIGTDSHVDQLSGIEVPVREHMHHRRLVVIRPCRLPHIV